jgi:large subunit ribosomal protein L6
MSKLGKIPVSLPKGVKVSVSNGCILIEGPKGKLSRAVPPGISYEVGPDKVKVSRKDDEKQSRAFHGLARSVLSNLVKGVSEGFSKTILAQGVGYRMSVAGSKLNISVGFSHPVSFDLPQGVSAKVDDQTKLTLSGVDRELIGMVADKIRAIRPPEPYKGKGLRYLGEVIQLKEGKSGAGAKTA